MSRIGLALLPVLVVLGLMSAQPVPVRAQTPSETVRTLGARFGIAALGTSDRAIFTNTSPVSGVDLGSAARISVTRPCALRVTVSLASSSTFKVTIKNGGTTKTATLNSAVALGAGQISAFSFAAHPNFTYDFQLGSDVAIDYLVVEQAELGST